MKEKINKKQLLLALTAVCLVGLIGVGISYAYYVANFQVKNPKNGNNNVTSASTTNVVMDIKSKTVTFDGVLPGHKEVKAFTVRGEGDTNAQPTEASIKVMPNLGVFSSDVTWKLYKSTEEVTCTSTQKHINGQYYEDSSCNIPSSATLELSGGSAESFKNIIVYPKTETEYYLVVEYANQGDQSNQQGQEFTINLDLGGKQVLITDKIIAQLDTTGKCPTVNEDGSVNVTGVEATDGYLCSAKDADGTSYYYRGNVTNNYVKFADKYWRIVRINGDGTVRVIYDGTSAHANGEDSSDRQIGTSAFNLYWKKDNVQESTSSYIYYDNAGVGYMYGNRDGVVEPTTQYSTSSFTNTMTYYIAKEYIYNASTDRFTLKDPIAVLGSAMTSDYVGYYTLGSTSASYSNSYVYKIFSVTAGSSSAKVGYGYVRYGTTSKEKAQTNTNDSTIKAYLDNWYKTNIVGTTNEQYLADNIFCNDRSISTGIPSGYSNLGYGTEITAYRWHYWAYSSYNNKMILTCPQQNDAFTVNDTSKGNGALTYPVGLLSTDEIVLAGGWWSNSGYYLCSGQYWWTSSPNFFYGAVDRVRNVASNGYADSSNDVSASSGVRPVFNLKAEVLAQGSGTATDPYRLS